MLLLKGACCITRLLPFKHNSLGYSLRHWKGNIFCVAFCASLCMFLLYIVQRKHVFLWVDSTGIENRIFRHIICRRNSFIFVVYKKHKISHILRVRSLSPQIFSFAMKKIELFEFKMNVFCFLLQQKSDVSKIFIKLCCLFLSIAFKTNAHERKPNETET